MKGGICLLMTVSILLLFADRFINEIDGCFATVPVDMIKIEQPAQATTSRAPRCPACQPQPLCATVALCNLNNGNPGDWVQQSPALTKEPANCVDFMASDDPQIAAGGGNVGTLTCENTGGVACLSGTWMGSPPGKWEATNLGTADPNTMGIFSYCSSPGVCKIFIGDSFDPNGILPDRQYTLVYKDGPTKTYMQPEFGDFDPMTTDGSNNFLLTDICCGTCDACVAAGCNPPL